MPAASSPLMSGPSGVVSIGVSGGSCAHAASTAAASARRKSVRNQLELDLERGGGRFVVLVFRDREAPARHEVADALVDFAVETARARRHRAARLVDGELERDLAAGGGVLL